VNISPLIRELLLQHEKVVIPGFGTFAISQRPAEINRNTGIIQPPSREILFDEKKHIGDGKLEDYVTKKQLLSREEATKAISLFVKSTQEQLRLSGNATIEGIGYLGRDKTGRYSFKATKELLGKVNIFDLPKLEIPVTQTTKPRTITPKPYVPPAVIPTEDRRKWWIPVALVVLLLGLSAIFYFTGLYKNFTSRKPVALVLSDDTGQDARLVFGNRNSSETDSMKDQIGRELDKRTAREEALLYEDSQREPPDTKEETITKPAQPAVLPAPKPYHIIAGAFQVKSNAERQIVSLESKGFSPVLLPKQGNFYMVSLGSYDTKIQAVTALNQLKLKLDQEFWVTRIK
jgi:nucleoid DNA-binding protein